MTTSDARIEGIVAREANVAVVFRRGPTKETQMLLWDLNTDEVTPGQWIRARVNARNCDVTPDGRLLVSGIYEALSRREGTSGRHTAEENGWTAISRPPYFTALALWFDGWGKGGHWSSARDLHLPEARVAADPDKGRLPARLRRHRIGGAAPQDRRVFEARLLREGWESHEPARYTLLGDGWENDRKILSELSAAGLGADALRDLYEREGPRHIQIGTAKWQRLFPGGRIERVRRNEGEETLRLVDDTNEVRLAIEGTDRSWSWIDLDARGRVIYGDRGCLWAWEEFPQGKPRLVADLNADRFQAVAPPDWAREWPSDSNPEW